MKPGTQVLVRCATNGGKEWRMGRVFALRAVKFRRSPELRMDVICNDGSVILRAHPVSVRAI